MQNCTRAAATELSLQAWALPGSQRTNNAATAETSSSYGTRQGGHGTKSTHHGHRDRATAPATHHPTRGTRTLGHADQHKERLRILEFKKGFSIYLLFNNKLHEHYTTLLTKVKPNILKSSIR